MLKKISIFSVFSIATYYTFTTNQQKKDIDGTIWSLFNSCRAGVILAHSIYDYKYQLANIQYNTQQYHKKRSEIHYRVANRILKLSHQNKGLYLKLGQYLGNLQRVVPREFTQTLCVLQDSVPPLQFDDIKIVIEEDLKYDTSQIFQSFQKNAISAASLAQVHKAKLRTGETVAVKIQYPSLRTQTQYDLFVLQKIVEICNWVMIKSGNHDIDLVKLFRTWTSTLIEELDFHKQIKNATKTKQFFQFDKNVILPKYYSQLSSSRIIVMQFMKGVKINDKKGIQALGLNPTQVAFNLVQIFAKMIFKSGHIHCDAHPGNILVRNVNQKPQIIILDHGLYRDISQQFLLNFSKLWISLISFDRQGVYESAQKLNIHQHIQFLPLIFLHRTIQSNKKIGAPITPEERKYLRSKDLANFESINKLLQDLPPQLMFVIRASNLISMHNITLGGDSRTRMFLYTRYCLENCYQKSWIRLITASIKIAIKIFLFQNFHWLFIRIFDTYLTS